jgi:hypothetical protein
MSATLFTFDFYHRILCNLLSKFYRANLQFRDALLHKDLSRTAAPEPRRFFHHPRTDTNVKRERFSANTRATAQRTREGMSLLCSPGSEHTFSRVLSRVFAGGAGAQAVVTVAGGYRAVEAGVFLRCSSRRGVAQANGTQTHAMQVIACVCAAAAATRQVPPTTSLLPNGIAAGL